MSFQPNTQQAYIVGIDKMILKLEKGQRLGTITTILKKDKIGGFTLSSFKATTIEVSYSTQKR